MGTLVREFKAVYGADSRREIAHVALPGSRYSLNRRATAALVDVDNLLLEDGAHRLRHVPFGHAYRLCTDEVFYRQPCAAFASGFLVQPDVLATAAHCIAGVDLDRVRVVFDYEVTRSGPRLSFDKDQVYALSGLIASGDPESADWALLRLARPVTGSRHPVILRARGRVDLGARVYMIGHPCGLPMKFADDALVTDVRDPTYFHANLDAFGGNSGSPVFAEDSDIVEGMLVRGSPDFFYDTEHGCRRTANFNVSTGADEEICRAPVFAQHIRGRGLANLHEPIGHGPPRRFEIRAELTIGEATTLLPLPDKHQSEFGSRFRRHLQPRRPARRRSHLSLTLGVSGDVEITAFPWTYRVDTGESGPAFSTPSGRKSTFRYFPRGAAAPVHVDVIVESSATATDVELVVVEGASVFGIIHILFEHSQHVKTRPPH